MKRTEVRIPGGASAVLALFLSLWLASGPAAAQVDSESLRPAAVGKNGVVATANPLASLAGQKMLVQGGNAFDAIVAAAAALNAAEPYMSGTAGVGYMLIYSAEEDRVRSLVFGGWAPERFDPQEFLQQLTFDDGAGHGTVETVGPASAAVPGNLAGWNRVLEDYGTMSLSETFAPAIELLEGGVPVTEYDQAMWRGTRNRVLHFPESNAIYLKDGEHPYEIGDHFANPALANTMRRIAEEGVDLFYRGEIAGQIAEAFRRDGGFITEADLAAVPDRVQWTEPLRIDYRGYTIYNHPPPGMGLQQLQTLRIMEAFDAVDFGHNSADYLAHLLEAVHVSRDDTDRHIGDPDFVDVPVDSLLSDAHIELQRKKVLRRVADRKRRTGTPRTISPDVYGEAVRQLAEPENAVPEMSRGVMPAAEGSAEEHLKAAADPRYRYATTSLSAADRWGNTVVITQTLGGGFGSGYVAGETGLVFNNAMEWMVMEPGMANSFEPGKGVGWCIGAMMQIFRDGKPRYLVGSPGSFGILQSVPQIAMNLIDFRMSIQEAIDAPRFRWRDELGSVPATEVIMESRVDEGVRSELEAMGFRLDTSVGEWSMSVGGAQGIRIDHDTGWIHGGADPRRNGYAVGW